MAPVKGRVKLTLDKNNNVEALFSDADGETVLFSFPTLTVSGSDILIDNARIGKVSGGKPSLNPGYSLQLEYGGVIDSCTGADRVAVDVFIQGPRP
ncbi:MAG: hypothetical protein KGL04_09255 [Elusimicrobia bacterium]|nr:hypothetical protein [Elusimicrobiota bacterium]